MFTDDEHPGEGGSAVKALAIASAEGQRIYTVTKENVNAVLPALNVSADVTDEIRDAVAVGKIATVSQNNMTVGGWTGVGYIIADPETGAGAYRISGGSNGAWADINLLLTGLLFGFMLMMLVGEVWYLGIAIAIILVLRGTLVILREYAATNELSNALNLARFSVAYPLAASRY